jgi:hypothetical protein
LNQFFDSVEETQQKRIALYQSHRDMARQIRELETSIANYEARTKPDGLALQLQEIDGKISKEITTYNRMCLGPQQETMIKSKGSGSTPAFSAAEESKRDARPGTQKDPEPEKRSTSTMASPKGTA